MRSTQSKCLRRIAAAAFAGCISFALLPSAQADTWNKKTTLTVTEPIQLPSCCTPGHTVTLQPGEYVIALVDSVANRHIVRVLDKDQRVITTILAIPNYRLTPTGNTVFQYWEVPAGQPRALRAWFYPGDNFGQEFAYPKQTAAQIAAFVKAPVPAIEMETNTPEDLVAAPLITVDDSGNVAELPLTRSAELQQPAAFSSERTEPQQATEIAETSAPTPAAEPMTAGATEKRLPDTASNMPLVGLIGLLSLGGFAALSLHSKHESQN